MGGEWNGRKVMEAHVIHVMGYCDFACSTVVCEVYCPLIRLKAFRAGAHQLKVEACCKPDP